MERLTVHLIEPLEDGYAHGNIYGLFDVLLLVPEDRNLLVYYLKLKFDPLNDQNMETLMEVLMKK